MSHFTRLKTRIKDITVLKECLVQMGYAVREGRQRVSGFQGQTVSVDLLVSMKEGYNIGFARAEDGCYEVVADWWGVRNTDRAGFAAQLEQQFQEVERQIRCQYAHAKVTTELKKRNFTIVEQKQEADGTVKLVARRFS